LERKYRLALDQLERLVVQRLMELQKCHVRGTNYKMRTHIAKHLQSRSKTIKTALSAYNRAVVALKRPQDKLDFNKVIAHDFLSQFDLLRSGRQDIRDKPWAKVENRLLRDTSHKVARAQEEIQRLNVEISRVLNWMQNERKHYHDAIVNAASISPYLAKELHYRLRDMICGHKKIHSSILKCAGLDGYDGPIVTSLDSELPAFSDFDNDNTSVDSEEENNYLDDFIDVLDGMEKLG